MPRKKREEKDSLLGKLEEEGELTVDVYETPEEVVIRTAVAGVKAEDLDIAITEDTVTIRGRRENEEATLAKDYLFQECFWGPFSRKIILPKRVDPATSQAQMKNNGILTIRLPKKKASEA